MIDVFLVQMASGKTDSVMFDKVRKLKAINNPGLIIFPEMFSTGYIPKNPADFAEDFSSNVAGPIAKFLSELANETGCAVMGAGIGRNASNKLTNHSSVYLPGQSTEFSGYNKVHPFFPELQEFAAGESVTLFKIGEWKIASTICYDLRFPELFRDAVKMGAKLITVQAAWPLIRKEHWETLLKARAIENQVYIAAVNGVGGEPALGGNSMIITPQGEIISRGSDNCEEIVNNTLNLSSLDEYRKAFPVLNGIV